MGRALFSLSYHDVVEPVACATESNPYVKWSSWNDFDPDSDEFFQNAQYEAFVDPDEYRRQQQQRPLDSAADADFIAPASVSSPSETSSSGFSDRGSPMAVGPDDPALMIADAYWDQRFLVAGAADLEWRRMREELASFHPPFIPRPPPRIPLAEPAEQPVQPGRINRPRSLTAAAAYRPPSSLRNSTTANEIDAELAGARERQESAAATINPANGSPVSAPSRVSGHRTRPSLHRITSIPPSVVIPFSPSSSSGSSTDEYSPSTPSDSAFAHEAPRPTAITVPASRSASWSHATHLPATAVAGSLTSPGARYPYSGRHLNVSPARIRVQNAAV